mmetsp:Transcript_40749/g.75432  ORF Transcript_40749/g.75432 Transcript_40749/m.75432 type:complete len:139 (-) Transcript_40749:327-743(-)
MEMRILPASRGAEHEENAAVPAVEEGWNAAVPGAKEDKNGAILSAKKDGNAAIPDADSDKSAAEKPEPHYLGFLGDELAAFPPAGCRTSSCCWVTCCCREPMAYILISVESFMCTQIPSISQYPRLLSSQMGPAIGGT